MIKLRKKFVLTLMTILFVIAPLTIVANVSAQGQASVTIIDSVGGTTDPPAGTQSYDAGTAVTLTATPDSGYAFDYWIIASTSASNQVNDNPTTLTVTGGETYGVQAVFSTIQAPPGTTLPGNLATAAIVVVLTSAGGTVSPSPGTYALADATSMKLTATPANGWQFSHWIISGPNLSHGGYPYTATPTENPYTVDHGYGNRYAYQAVFTPVGTTENTPTPTAGGGTVMGLSTEFIIIIALVIVIVVILIAFAVFAMRRKH